MGPVYGHEWKCLPVPKDYDGKAAIHSTTVYKVFARWLDDGSLAQAFIASVRHLADHNQLDLSILHGDGTNTVAKKGGDGLGYSGHKHQKGEKVIAIIDNNGYVLAPLPVAPVNEADTVLLPEGLKALKRVARLTGLERTGSYLNLDSGFDATSNRKAIFNAGMMPNIKENPRNELIASFANRSHLWKQWAKIATGATRASGAHGLKTRCHHAHSRPHSPTEYHIFF
jgi:hypothetical protein